MEVQDIFEDLPDPGPINADEDNEYVVCLRKLDAHFRAVDNVPYERHVTHLQIELGMKKVAFHVLLINSNLQPS